MRWLLPSIVLWVLVSSAAWGAPAWGTTCVDHYADLYHVPRELVLAIIEVESSWQPHAISRKGAVGLMQLMPTTAVAFGVRNRFRAEENVAGGVAYLAVLLRRFGGDLRLVTAAYFAGERRIAERGLSFSSPEVYADVHRVAAVYRRLKIESRR